MTAGRVTAAEARARIAGEAEPRSVEVFHHATLQVKVYAPRGVDRQKPHSRDEVYVILSGSGTFFDGEERHRLGPGDFLFVAAGRDHRFEHFSDDFATWVLFYGPEGGEAANAKPSDGMRVPVDEPIGPQLDA
jgi:mannose-6-phosphate isomerase-like protein (cupin superfamily)